MFFKNMEEQHLKTEKAANKDFLMGFNLGFFVLLGFVLCSLGLYHCNSTFACFKTCYPLQYRTCNNDFVKCANNIIKNKKEISK